MESKYGPDTEFGLTHPKGRAFPTSGRPKYGILRIQVWNPNTESKYVPDAEPGLTHLKHTNLERHINLEKHNCWEKTVSLNLGVGHHKQSREEGGHGDRIKVLVSRINRCLLPQKETP